MTERTSILPKMDRNMMLILWARLNHLSVLRDGGKGGQGNGDRERQGGKEGENCLETLGFWRTTINASLDYEPTSTRTSV